MCCLRIINKMLEGEYIYVKLRCASGCGCVKELTAEPQEFGWGEALG